MFFLSTKLKWLYWPIYIVLKFFKVCFVINILEGVGHLVSELDNFFHKLDNNLIEGSKRYFWIRLPTSTSMSCIKLYGHKFYFAKCSTFYYYLFLPIILAYEDLTIDCGCSRLKLKIVKNNNLSKLLPV